MDAIPGANITKNYNGYFAKDTINLGLDYREDKWDVGLAGRAAFGREGKENSGSTFFPAKDYWIWDIGINYKVNTEMKVFVKVNNIFDKLYAEQSAADNVRPENWYTMPGRNVIFGMSYTF